MIVWRCDGCDMVHIWRSGGDRVQVWKGSNIRMVTSPIALQ